VPRQPHIHVIAKPAILPEITNHKGRPQRQPPKAGSQNRVIRVGQSFFSHTHVEPVSEVALTAICVGLAEEF
jgi:hypothetical protein